MQQGQTVTADPGSWTGSPAPAFSYQWQRCDSGGLNCADITGADRAELPARSRRRRLDDPRPSHRQQQRRQRHRPLRGHRPIAAAPVAPQNTVAPAVNGTMQQGQTVTADPGSWTGSPARPSATSGSAATAAASTAPTSPGRPGRATCSQPPTSARRSASRSPARNSAGNATAPSAATGPIAAAPVAPQNTVAPAVNGTMQQGQTVTADPGSWTGSPAPAFSYQWQRCDSGGLNCADITGQTGQSYLLAAADVGSTIRVQVTGSNSAGNATAPSAATGPIAGPGPIDPVLDDFNRANGSIGTNWAQIISGFVDFTISSNQAIDPSASSFAWDYWVAHQFGPDSEAYATITTVSADAVRVCARLTSPTSTKRSGYCVQEAANSWTIRRIDSGAANQIGGTVTQTAGAGSRIGITVIGTTVTAWYSPGANAGWTQLLTTTDGTYQGAGYIALEARGSHIDNFGGGAR